MTGAKLYLDFYALLWPKGATAWEHSELWREACGRDDKSSLPGATVGDAEAMTDHLMFVCERAKVQTGGGHFQPWSWRQSGELQVITMCTFTLLDSTA